MNLPTLIVIDDEKDLAELVCDVAEQAGFYAFQFNEAILFKQQYNNSADVIILDLMMPDVDGIEIIRYLAEIKCDALLILVSGFDSGVLHSAQKLAIEQGLNFVASLNKPFRPGELSLLLSGLSITPKGLSTNNETVVPTLDELRKALVNDELIVYYQPKVSLNHQSMAAVEALVRWQHPKYGLICPDLFIPIAEKHTLIDELTWIVLEQALTQCKLWNDRGLTVKIAINMSASTLKELYLPEKLDQLIKKTWG